MYFQWIQLKDAIPSAYGKKVLKRESNVNNDRLTIDHHAIKVEMFVY